MSRIVCFIDKEGFIGTCPKDIAICSKCQFKKKYEGKEKEYFVYTAWTGNLKLYVKEIGET